MATMTTNPKRLNIRYLNVQNWTTEKNAALAGHLTSTDPDIILAASTSKTIDQPPIKIPNYITFSTNKLNERHAGCAIAIKRGIKFEILNNFSSDFIAAKVQTTHGPVIVATAYTPPRCKALPHQDINYMINHNLPMILAADLNTRHSMFGYTTGGNTKGCQLYNHIYNNRLNYLGPTFNTFYTRNSETKPDCNN